MKLIILGGGALQVKTLKVTKGITPAQFISTTLNGSAIMEKLKERSSKINWADAFGRIDWCDIRGNPILWFLTDDASGV